MGVQPRRGYYSDLRALRQRLRGLFRERAAFGPAPGRASDAFGLMYVNGEQRWKRPGDALRRDVDDRGHEAEYFGVRGAARPRSNLAAPRGQALGVLRGKDDAIVVLPDQADV